jgi:hypothetical protein
VGVDGTCPRLRPAGVGADGACQHALPLSRGGMTPQSPAEVGAEMGNVVVCAPRRSSAKRPVNLERAGKVRRMRDG